MSKAVVIGVILAGLSGAAIAIQATVGLDKVAKMAMPDRDAPFLEACENTLKERLKSPSGYVRAEVTGPIYEPATVDHLLMFSSGTGTSAANLELIASGLEYVWAAIEYDAPNSFGAAIRGIYQCEGLVDSGQAYDPDTLTSREVLVDGVSRHQWLIKSLGG